MRGIVAAVVELKCRSVAWKCVRIMKKKRGRALDHHGHVRAALPLVLHSYWFAEPASTTNPRAAYPASTTNPRAAYPASTTNPRTKTW
jgi:hypothetical protein